MSTARIPLFPLEVVLLPEAVLPLHIFEPRYKEMIGRCLAQSEEFGVVLQREDGVVATGCTAEITQTLKQYEDGRYDLLTVGRRPFHIRAVIEEKSYYEAEVEFLEDESAAAPRDNKGLVGKYAEIHRILFGEEPSRFDPEEAESLAYAIAGDLPLELEFKQQLLESRSEPERQRMLFERLEKWIPIAARQQHIRRVAGGNGHGLQ